VSQTEKLGLGKLPLSLPLAFELDERIKVLINSPNLSIMTWH
jgi:hypothetical protein